MLSCSHAHLHIHFPGHGEHSLAVQACSALEEHTQLQLGTTAPTAFETHLPAALLSKRG